jgi:hypothetical protein
LRSTSVIDAYFHAYQNAYFHAYQDAYFHAYQNAYFHAYQMGPFATVRCDTETPISLCSKGLGHQTVTSQ